MQLIKKLTMFSMIVSDMTKSKGFYADKLGLKIKTDYRQDDDHWWVTLTLPEVNITLTTFHENFKQGTTALYFATSDIFAAHKELNGKSVKVNEVKDDLYGPGSRVKWFNFNDPDGNLVHIVQE
jgi:catechol 2,3-dioxygenase-like lactoylglutathione lyase family enzyme